MADIICFDADQHYPATVTSGLLRRGIDVLTAHEAGQCGANDPSNSRMPQHWAAYFSRLIPISSLYMTRVPGTQVSCGARRRSMGSAR